MDFTLKYAGELLSDRAKHANQAKHQLRKHFREQLDQQWQQNAFLKRCAEIQLQQAAKRGKWYEVDRPIAPDRTLFWGFEMGGYDFVPIVNHVHLVHCHMAIRMHRPKEHGGILYEGGDMDNGLKVIFDALSMPQHQEQVVETRNSKESKTFHCLLESDELITKLSVETFRLLSPGECGDNYVEMDIDVHIEPIYPMNANLSMLFP